MLVQSGISSSDLVSVREDALRSHKVFEVNGLYVGMVAVADSLAFELGLQNHGILAGSRSSRDAFVSLIDQVLEERNGKVEKSRS